MGDLDSSKKVLELDKKIEATSKFFFKSVCENVSGELLNCEKVHPAFVEWAEDHKVSLKLLKRETPEDSLKKFFVYIEADAALGKNEKLKQDVFELIKIEKEREVDYADVEESFGKNVDKKAFGIYVFTERRKALLRKLFGSLDDDEVIKLNEQLYNLRKSDVDGCISEIEYLKEFNRICNEAIEKSDDEELKKRWTGVAKAESVEIGFLFEDSPSAVDVIAESDLVVRDEAEVNSFFENVIDFRFDMEFENDSSVSVDVGNGLFVKVFVCKNPDTNEYFCYLFDDYSDGLVKVEPDNILSKLDERHLDSYFSKNIVLPPSVSASRVADADVVYLCQMLIGKGDSRGYEIKDKNKEVLDYLLKLLSNEDDFYNSVIDLVHVLKTRSDGEFAWRQLLDKKVDSIEGLLGLFLE